MKHRSGTPEATRAHLWSLQGGSRAKQGVQGVADSLERRFVLLERLSRPDLLSFNCPFWTLTRRGEEFLITFADTLSWLTCEGVMGPKRLTGPDRLSAELKMPRPSDSWNGATTC